MGSLINLSTSTRPAIKFSLIIFSRLVEAPLDRHWRAAKGILRYVLGTYGHRIIIGDVRKEKKYLSWDHFRDIAYCDRD